MIAKELYPEPRDYLEYRAQEDQKLAKITCDPYRREFEAEELDYLLGYSKLRFNTSTLKLQVDGLAVGAEQDDSFPVSAGGALRLLKKYSLWSDINSFLSQGVEELWMDGRPDDIPDCVCRKDGRWYALRKINRRAHYSGEEYFVPIEVFNNPFHHYSCARKVSISEVKAVMSICFAETFYIDPLDTDDWCVDFPEFKLGKYGFATDGSGVIYEGVRCVDKLVRLFTYVPCGQDFVDKVINDNQRLSKEKFIELICKKADEKLEFERKMREEREDRGYEDMADLEWKGLVDIYGEPDGWRFNNEDWC